MLLLFRLRSVLHLLVALALARLAAAQAPTLDMVAYCGDAQTTNSFANAQAMQTDAQGNILVAGSIYGTVSFGSFVLTSHSGVKTLSWPSALPSAPGYGPPAPEAPPPRPAALP